VLFINTLVARTFLASFMTPFTLALAIDHGTLYILSHFISSFIGTATIAYFLVYPLP